MTTQRQLAALGSQCSGSAKLNICQDRNVCPKAKRLTVRATRFLFVTPLLCEYPTCNNMRERPLHFGVRP